MTDYTRHFERIAEAVAELPEDVLLDGEAVVFHSDGHSNFEALRGRGARDAVLVAFDILEVEGCDLQEEALERRRSVLDGLLSDAPDGIMLSQWIEGDGPAIFEAACGLGLEGIISKRLGTKYQSGRCQTWLKTKNSAFVHR
jgi:bifunctional non-homologous end joining protein LigD